MVCHFLHHQGNPEFTQRRNKNKDFRNIRNVGMVNSTRGETEREREQGKPFWNRAFFSPSFTVPPLHFPSFIYIYTKKLFPSTTTDEDGFFSRHFSFDFYLFLSPFSAGVNARKWKRKRQDSNTVARSVDLGRRKYLSPHPLLSLSRKIRGKKEFNLASVRLGNPARGQRSV